MDLFQLLRLVAPEDVTGDRETDTRRALALAAGGAIEEGRFLGLASRRALPCYSVHGVSPR